MMVRPVDLKTEEVLLMNLTDEDNAFHHPRRPRKRQRTAPAQPQHLVQPLQPQHRPSVHF
jgi:hypothetical protein